MTDLYGLVFIDSGGGWLSILVHTHCKSVLFYDAKFPFSWLCAASQIIHLPNALYIVNLFSVYKAYCMSVIMLGCGDKAKGHTSKSFSLIVQVRYATVPSLWKHLHNKGYKIQEHALAHQQCATDPMLILITRCSSFSIVINTVKSGKCNLDRQ